MSKPVRRARNNCTAKDPSKCRYHGVQFQQHPLAANHKALQDYFIKTEQNLNPNMVIRSPYKNATERSNALMEHMLDIRGMNEKSLTDDELSSFHAYTDEHGSTRIRTVLMNPEKTFDFNGLSMERIHFYIKNIDNAIFKHSVDVQDKVLWRGVPDLKYELEGVEEGGTVSFKTYLSTSLDSEVATQFTEENHPVILKIKAKKGFFVSGLFGSEQEVLLKRDTTFKVKRITENVHVEKVSVKFGKDPVLRGVTLLELEEI